MMATRAPLRRCCWRPARPGHRRPGPAPPVPPSQPGSGTVPAARGSRQRRRCSRTSLGQVHQPARGPASPPRRCGWPPRACAMMARTWLRTVCSVMPSCWAIAAFVAPEARPREDLPLPAARARRGRSPDASGEQLAAQRPARGAAPSCARQRRRDGRDQLLGRAPAVHQRARPRLDHADGRPRRAGIRRRTSTRCLAASRPGRSAQPGASDAPGSESPRPRQRGRRSRRDPRTSPARRAPRPGMPGRRQDAAHPGPNTGSGVDHENASPRTSPPPPTGSPRRRAPVGARSGASRRPRPPVGSGRR